MNYVRTFWPFAQGLPGILGWMGVQGFDWMVRSGLNPRAREIRRKARAGLGVSARSEFATGTAQKPVLDSAFQGTVLDGSPANDVVLRAFPMQQAPTQTQYPR
jgi:hypothetical protein